MRTREEGLAYAEQVTHSGATARLFVAVDPPLEVCEQLAAWARDAAREAKGGSGEGGLRVLDPELLHVTLCFLGNRATAEIEAIAERLGGCGGSAGELSVGAPLWLPPRRPRALAVELHDNDGRLRSLQGSVTAMLEEPGGQGPDSAGGKARATKHRHFRAHVTVARMRSGAAPSKRMLPPTPALSFTFAEVTLYRSWLSPEGATYEALACHPLH